MIILQFFDSVRMSYLGKRKKCVDIAAGRLPTPVLLAESVKSFLTSGSRSSVVIVASLVSTYALTPKESA